MTAVAFILAGIGVLVTAALTYAFWHDPVKGMAQTTHRAELLPQVMTGRYAAFTWLALFATLYRDLAVIAAIFAAFAFMAFADAWIYRRAGHPVAKHLGAGVASGLVVLVALIAIGGGG